MKSCSSMQNYFSNTNRKVKSSSTFFHSVKKKHSKCLSLDPCFFFSLNGLPLLFAFAGLLAQKKLEFMTSILRFFITFKTGLKFRFHFSYRIKKLRSTVYEKEYEELYKVFLSAGSWQWQGDEKISMTQKWIDE